MDAIQTRLEAQFPKRCRTCGVVHSRAGWSALPLHSFQTDDVVKLEQRDCPCGSTLVVEVEVYNLAELEADDFLFKAA
jgi:hypothetical protein